MLDIINYDRTFVSVYIGGDITIYDSYMVKSLKEMRGIIDSLLRGIIDSLYRKYLVGRNQNRTKFDMVNEWRVHKLLYRLHVLRKHTKDVDFEYKQPIILKVLYAIVSLFYFHYR